MAKKNKPYLEHVFTGQITELGKKMRDERLNTRLNTRLYNPGRRKSVIITMDKCIVNVIEIFEDGTQKEIYDKLHQWHTCVYIWDRWIRIYTTKGYEEVSTKKTAEEPVKKKRGRPPKELNTTTEIPKA